jgi:hypothetical protein
MNVSYSRRAASVQALQRGDAIGVNSAIAIAVAEGEATMARSVS